MPTNSTQALSDLQAFQGSRRKSQDILRESETTLGLPSATQRQAGLRAAITNTENLIRAVDPSVSGRTQGSLVTEAQKTRLVGMERAPLDEAFRTQNQAYEGETGNVNELKRRALQDTQLALSEDDRRQQDLSGLYSTLYGQEQDAVAKAERDRAFAEAQRQSQASAAGLAGLFGGGSKAPTSLPATPATDPIQQEAYNDVRTRISGDDKAIRSDYAATLASARRGNAKDKLKIQLYAQLRPDLFGSTPSSALVSNKLSF